MNEGGKFLEAVSGSAKLMYKHAKSTCDAHPVDSAWLLDPLARWSQAAYGETIFTQAAEGYARYCLTVAKFQREYEATGVYNPDSLAEVSKSVYEEPDYMIPYMWAAVLIYPFWPSMTGHIGVFRDQFLNVLGETPKLLELGCGHGVLGLLAAEHRADAIVHGIDLSASAIEIAERLRGASGLADRVRVEIRDATGLSPNGGGDVQYDGIIFAMLAEHVENPSALLRAVRRNLASSGIVYFSTAIESPQPDHIYEFHSEAEVIQLAEQAGLRCRSMVSDGQRISAEAKYRPCSGNDSRAPVEVASRRQAAARRRSDKKRKRMSTRKIEENMSEDNSRPFNPEPSYYPPLHGDILSRVNLLKFIREFLRVSDLPDGVYMEFGVFNGESLLDAYRMLRGRVTHFYGLDTFAGLPELSAADGEAQQLMPVFAAGNMQSMSCEQVRATVVAQTGMPPDQLTLLEGRFSDSPPAVRDSSPVLVANVDCDLHSSTMDALQVLESQAVTGTWLLLDDYWCYRGSPKHGQQRALREWLATSRFGANDYGNFKGWGRAFILYEK